MTGFLFLKKVGEKMSFSSEVKEEISKLSNLANKNIVKYEFLGYIATSHITIEKNKLKFSTENEYNINRFGKLLSNLNYPNYEIEMNGRNFCITIPAPKLDEIENKNNKIFLKNDIIEKNLNESDILAKAFIRGAFLGSGSISNPQNTYHLEILFETEDNAHIALNILKQYQIFGKILKKKNDYSLYIKDGDEIANFLALIQANKSVLKYEDIRVLRDIRNDVNRKVNCETANLTKTIDAAVKQIEDINYLQEIGELKHLTKALQEIAKLRLENPDASMQELGKMLQIPIGKSGVNHRLKAIQKIAQEKREN